MKILTVIVLFAAASVSHAAGNSESFMLAQAADQAKAQNKPAKAAAPTPPPPGPSCDMDGRFVPDKATWCVKMSLQLCNAATGKWINTGKNC